MIRNLVPMGHFDHMENEFAKMEKLMNSVFSGNTFWSSEHSSFPKINIVEYKDKFVIEAGLAGYSKDEVKLSLEQRGLRISGKHQEGKEVKNDDAKYHLKELSSRAFEKVVILPESIDKAKITSKLKDGILSISLPLKDEVKKESKVIEIE